MSKAVDLYHSLALQASEMLVAGQLDIFMLFAGKMKRKDVLLINIIKQRISRRMVEEPLVEINHQLVTMKASTNKINGMLPRVEMVSSSLERNLCVGVERWIVV